MIKDPEISGHDFVLQDCSGRNVDPVTRIGDDDEGSSEGNASAEHHVTGNGQVVQLQDIRYGGKPLQEITHLK